jgi:hypothetical protein
LLVALAGRLPDRCFFVTQRRLTACRIVEISRPVNLPVPNFQYGLKITRKRKMVLEFEKVLLSCLVEAHGYVVPVDNAPPSVNILGPVVHVVQVVGVLPDVKGE